MFQINWKLKAVLYKVFSILKLKKFFYFIQKYITKRSKINFTKINKSWVFHFNSIKANNAKKLLEVGAGKSLEQNIYFSYKFNKKIEQTVIDIEHMLDLDLFNQANKRIVSLLKSKSYGEVKNIKDLRLKYNIIYKAPFKIIEFKAKEKFDICTSTNALEHFRIIDLHSYLVDLKKVMSKKGLVSSIIDYSDHYSHTDKNIDGLNFLSFSKKKWEKYNNSYLYQNRLRHQDYKKLFINQGYKIIKETKGNLISPTKKISDEFDSANNENFLNWAYFLIKISN